MAYYSYCCGKYVDRKEGITKRGEGYICSRCKQELTLYGNPKSEEAKKALKEKRAVKGRGHKVLPNGDLQLIDTVYKFADENTVPSKQVNEKWVIFNEYGNFIACILLEHDTGAFYEVLEPLNNRLLKERLSGIRLSTATNYGYTVKSMKEQSDLKPLLKQVGWKITKDGRIR